MGAASPLAQRGAHVVSFKPKLPRSVHANVHMKKTDRKVISKKKKRMRIIITRSKARPRTRAETLRLNALRLI